jgi:hypothetical protein
VSRRAFVATYACVLPQKSPQKVEPGAARLSRSRRVVSRIFAISLSVDDSPTIRKSHSGILARHPQRAAPTDSGVMCITARPLSRVKNCTVLLCRVQQSPYVDCHS